MEPLDARPDADLVAVVAERKPDALEELYRRHSVAVFGVARRGVTGVPEHAEEVLQEVFLRLWRSPERFDPTRGALRSFLCMDANARAIELVRLDAARRGREERTIHLAELRELLGAYALDALDPEERQQVDELLLTDASARAELHELEHAAAWLGHASLRPPESAWDAIAAEMDSDLVADAPEPEPEVTAPTPLRPRRVSQWLVAAAAVVILAVGAVGAVALVRNSSSSNSSSASSKFAKAERDPLARKVILRSADGRYSAPAAVLPNRTGYLSSAAMPAAPSGRDLQLWAITPDGPVSLGLMRGHGDLHQFRIAPATKELAITSEPRGGSTAPTGNPIVSGDLPPV